MPLGGTTQQSDVSQAERSHVLPAHQQIQAADIGVHRREGPAAKFQPTIGKPNILSDPLPLSLVLTWAQYSRCNITWATLKHGTASNDTELYNNHYMLDVEPVQQVEVNAVEQTFVCLTQKCYHVPVSTACDRIGVTEPYNVLFIYHRFS